MSQTLQRTYSIILVVLLLSGCAIAEEGTPINDGNFDRPAGDEISRGPVGGQSSAGSDIPLAGQSRGMNGGEDMGPIEGGDQLIAGMVAGEESRAGDETFGGMVAGEVVGAGTEMAGTEMAGAEMAGTEIAGTEIAGTEMAGETLPPVDQDQDGFPDALDNCPGIYNPEQSDIDGDSQGDACEPDADFDGIPDEWDPAPMDANWPGRSLPDTVYAHTSTELFSLNVKTLQLESVANFSFDQNDTLHEVTDIAIDRSGVLWAISFGYLWICHPRLGTCRDQGALPTANFNGLTFLPGEIVNAQRDILVGIETTGEWRRLDPANGIVDSQFLGSYPVERSSGDVFSIDGVGTYAAVIRDGVEDNVLISVNPGNPAIIEDVVTLTGYNQVYGLAGWQGQLFAFDGSGAILRVDLNTNQVTEVGSQDEVWWGAGVSSIIYSLPD